jgi:hypothetical protein
MLGQDRTLLGCWDNNLGQGQNVGTARDIAAIPLTAERQLPHLDE